MDSIHKNIIILLFLALSLSTFGQKVYIQAALYKDSLLYYQFGTTSARYHVPATILDYYPEHNGVFKIQITNVDSMAFCKNRLLELPHYNILYNEDRSKKIKRIDTLICYVFWRDISAPEETYKSILKLKANKDSLYKANVERQKSLKKK